MLYSTINKQSTPSPATIVEVQVLAMIGSNYIGAGTEEANQDSSESLLLARGLEISSPPTIHQVLDGQPLLRWVVDYFFLYALGD